MKSVHCKGGLNAPARNRQRLRLRLRFEAPEKDIDRCFFVLDVRSWVHSLFTSFLLPRGTQRVLFGSQQRPSARKHLAGFVKSLANVLPSISIVIPYFQPTGLLCTFINFAYPCVITKQIAFFTVGFDGNFLIDSHSNQRKDVFR